MFSTGIQGIAWPMLLALSLVAGGTAIWFVVIQLVVIGRWCAFCMTIHALALIGLLIVLKHLPPANILASSWNASHTLVTMGALSCVAVFIAGQLLLQPKQYAVMECDRDMDLEPSSETDQLQVPILSVPRGREVRLVGGRVTLRTGACPILGSPDADLIVAYLFDFTCPSCRRIHHMLADAVTQLSPRLAVLTLPVPQEPQCNSNIQVASPAATGRACRFAQLAMSIWSEFPDRYTHFEQWLFETEELPSFDAAVAHAQSLTGCDNLVEENSHTDADRLIATGVAAHYAARTLKIPTILLPRATIAGEVPSAEKLLEILRKEFSVQLRPQVSDVK